MDDIVTSNLHFQTAPQARRERRPVPDPNRIQTFPQPPPAHPDGNALTRQQPLDPVGQARLLLLQRPDLSLHVPPVFLLRRRHLHHTPKILLPCPVPQQHREQLPRIQPIRLGPPRPAVDLDGGGVHHQVDDPHLCQLAMQPKPLTPRLVARKDPTASSQTQPPPSLAKRLAQTHQIPRPNRYLPRLLSHHRSKRQLPVLPAQLECHEHPISHRDRLLSGRRLCHTFLSFH